MQLNLRNFICGLALAIGYTATPPVSWGAPATLRGPMPSTTNLWAVLLSQITTAQGDRSEQVNRLAKFTAAEKQILQNVLVHPDSADKRAFYTVSPFRLTRPWHENKLYINFAAVDRTFKALDALGDLDADSLDKIVKVGKSSMTDAEKTAAISKLFNSVGEDARAAFVRIIQTQATDLNLSSDIVKDFHEALTLSSLILNVPVAQAQIAIAPSYNLEKADAIQKFVEAVPEITFYNMSSVTSDAVWTLGAPQPVSPPLDGAGQDHSLRDTFDVLAAINNRTMTKALDMKVSATNAGTVIGVDLYYNLVAGWGDTKTEYAPYVVLPFTGGFTTTRTLDLSFAGKVECRFRAEVKYAATIDIAKQNNYAIVETTIPAADNREFVDMAQCILYDEEGHAVSGDDGQIMIDKIPEAIGRNAESARLLTTLLQGKIKEYKDSFSTEYIAVQSLKNDILAEALHRADGWRALPVPTTTSWRNRWENSNRCVQVPRQGACIKTGSRWEWHGWKSSLHSYCTQWATEYTSSCRDIQELIDYAVQVPVPVRYIDKVEFNRVLDEVKSFPLAFSTKQTFDLYAGNDILPTRELISGSGTTAVFRRDEGDIGTLVEQRSAATRDVLPIRGTPASEPATDPTAGRTSGATTFDPFSRNH